MNNVWCNSDDDQWRREVRENHRRSKSVAKTTILVEWKDHREHCYEYQVSHVPRVGDSIEINGSEFIVTEVKSKMESGCVMLKTKAAK